MQPLPSPRQILDLHAQSGAALADAWEVPAMNTRAAELASIHTGGSGFSDDGRQAEAALVGLVRDCVLRALVTPELTEATATPAFSARPGTFGVWTTSEHAVLARYAASGARSSD
jgi:hypothetical protein